MEENNKKRWFNFLGRTGSGSTIEETITPHPDARPLTWEEKESIKDEYANGREYFIFAGDIDHNRHELILLLKAFSQFKKWQRSEMKLIIAGNATKLTEELKHKLATFKYKEDVVLIENPQESALLKLIAACYAFVYLDKKDVFSSTILNALQSQVPVIVSQSPTIEKNMDERGIVLPLNSDQLAHQLILLYRDEAFRTEIIKRGIKN